MVSASVRMIASARSPFGLGLGGIGLETEAMGQSCPMDLGLRGRAAVVTGVATDADALAACVRAVEDVELPPEFTEHVKSRETLRLAPASRSLLR